MARPTRRAEPPATGAKRNWNVKIALKRFGAQRQKYMILRKVYGGTPVGNESRCTTCTNARIIEGYAESERMVFCDAMYPTTRIPFNVRECSMYEDKRLPDFEQMQKIAWQIRSKSAGNVAGFVTVPEAVEEREPDAEQPEEVPAAAKTDK